MSRHVRGYWAALLSAAILASGCQPVQPFFFKEDGDLSHYMDVATQIEYPDVEEPMLDEAIQALDPLSLSNSSSYEIWELTLEEAVRITLHNSQVMRQIGGRVATQAPETISRTLVSPVGVATTYDVALTESAVGTGSENPFGGTGVEAALAEFDARLNTSVFWEKNRIPQNRPSGGVAGSLFPPILAQDVGTFTADITKTTAEGTTWTVRNNTDYLGTNLPLATRPLRSDWTTNFEAEFNHPLLQGRGTQYNRIARPLSFQQYAAGANPSFDGVVIARIRTDLTLADFEGSLRNLVRDVEDQYWELYFAYRNLEALTTARDSALETWRNTQARRLTGARGGEAASEAQARSQYYLFRTQVEDALSALYSSEALLRWVLGLSSSDGRLIRPADKPTTARVEFDWVDIRSEGLVRRVEVRKKKWEIKRRELELIAARNHLLPRLDAVGRYRWRGIGDDLIDADGNGIDSNMNGMVDFNEPGSNAFETLTGGAFQEWMLGLQLSIDLGYRRQLSMVRHHQLLLARERAILQDLELEVVHQLGDALRELDRFYTKTDTAFNWRVSAEEEVQAVRASYDEGLATLNELLDAQQRRAEAESEYYRALVDYNRAIMNVHFRKGSLLDYNSVQMAEGPWPAKAYFDAVRNARQRDASLYLDYGFTRPDVMSRGPYLHGGHGGTSQETEYYWEPEAVLPTEAGPDAAYEEIPTPGNGAMGLPAEGALDGESLLPNPFDNGRRVPGPFDAGAPMPDPIELPPDVDFRTHIGPAAGGSYATADAYQAGTVSPVAYPAGQTGTIVFAGDAPAAGGVVATGPSIPWTPAASQVPGPHDQQVISSQQPPSTPWSPASSAAQNGPGGPILR